MSFQSSLSGISAASQKLDVIGANVANAETVGFKESTARFSDIFFSKTATGQAGSGAAGVNMSRQFTQGGVTMSGNVLDVAINGKGFFQVMSPDGSLAYTRNGQFHTDSNMFLVTPEGDKVMGANGPIQIDMTKYATSLRISPEGLIQGSDGVTKDAAGNLALQTLDTLQLHSFRNIDGLIPVGDNKWDVSSVTGAQVSGAPGSGILGVVQAGATEDSNADLGENLVSMIVAQREFQGNSQILQIQKDMDLSLAKL
ncbi:MAG: flagellar hook basal-body protein [Sulfuricellaceae bacterium]